MIPRVEFFTTFVVQKKMNVGFFVIYGKLALLPE